MKLATHQPLSAPRPRTGRLGRLVRHAQRLALGGAAWLATCGPALAQSSSSEPKGPDWVVPYLIVGACVAFGIFIVCMPARRSFEVKQDKYQ
jgi:hypothetical protein